LLIPLKARLSVVWMISVDAHADSRRASITSPVDRDMTPKRAHRWNCDSDARLYSTTGATLFAGVQEI